MKATLFLVLAFAVYTALAEVDDDQWIYRIVGGDTAGDAAYPYQVSLKTTSGSHFCGGCIITERTILTAAHCLNGRNTSNTVVVVGTNYLSTGGITYSTYSIKLHPNYDADTFENDVGLVITNSEISLNSRTKIITTATNFIGAGATVTLTGWGFTSYPGSLSNTLQVINLKTLNETDCRSRLSGVGTIYGTSLCTLTRSGQGACQGDSGSPLVNEGRVVGILSWGSPCATGYPDVFARITEFSSWIEANKV